jgi:predicted DNA-binding protein YlxM (UPF0122 family)
MDYVLLSKTRSPGESCKRYLLQVKIHSDTWLGFNIVSGATVTIKFELINTEHPFLHHEASFYSHLASGVDIPTKRAQIWTRYLDGYSIPEIVAQEATKRSTVRGIIKRAEKYEKVASIQSLDLVDPRKPTDRDDRHLLRVQIKTQKIALKGAKHS